jgi:hypothetical protein
MKALSRRHNNISFIIWLLNVDKRTHLEEHLFSQRKSPLDFQDLSTSLSRFTYTLIHFYSMLIAHLVLISLSSACRCFVVDR